MNIAIRLDRYSPPEGRIRRPHGGEVHFAGWLELLNVLETELERLAKDTKARRDVRPGRTEGGL